MQYDMAHKTRTHQVLKGRFRQGTGDLWQARLKALDYTSTVTHNRRAPTFGSGCC